MGEIRPSGSVSGEWKRSVCRCVNNQLYSDMYCFYVSWTERILKSLVQEREAGYGREVAREWSGEPPSFSSTTGSHSRTSMWDHSIAQTPMQDTFFAAITVIARHECLTQILNRDSPLF
jgi:hypothetical protein